MIAKAKKESNYALLSSHYKKIMCSLSVTKRHYVSSSIELIVLSLFRLFKVKNHGTPC